MRSAIYYPHTEIQNTEFLKSSLLLWDKVDLIVPFHDYQFDRSKREFAQAIDLLCRGLVPSQSQKAEAHALIEEFATRPLPECFFYFPDGTGHYMTRGVWPQKLLPETWDMLQNLRFTHRILANNDYPLQDAAAMTIMSLLADCCAGDLFARITDRGAAYAAINNLLTCSAGRHETELESEHTIVPLTLKILNTSKISLGQLIHFRQREEVESGNSLRDLRHRYADRINQHVTELKYLSRRSDRLEASRQFHQDMKDDLLELKSELRSNVTTLALSKEVIVTTLAVAGSAFSAAHLGLELDLGGAMTAAGGVITMGGLAASGSRYLTSRLATLRRHPMAYLYELRRT